ncbi:MAG: hypothetical protein IKB30_01395 [Clostridia bacterium]|nr:hypothetical protein [Clostridia bacterium]MBR2499394.1 hypothetical protein [Clostridia bacterium]
MNLMIFGDSYSTYEGYIPEGYGTYYCKNGREDGAPASKIDFENTWWAKLIADKGYNLVVNDSWTGATICYTGYDGADCSQTKSFIRRYHNMLSSGFFEKNQIDMLLLFGATNDSWANSPLGEVKTDNITHEDLYFVFPAITYLLQELKRVLPQTKIYFIINDELKDEIVSHIKSETKRFGIETIELSEVKKEGGHPTVEGMDTIYRQIKSFLDKE